MNQLNKINKISAILVAAIILFLLLPSVFTKGMFLDGIVYATVSRNMAEGAGSFWHLHYTSTLYPTFYEHPPLSFFIQSLFFKIMGDSMYTERAYMLFTALINACLIALIWKTLFKNSDKKLFWWIPVLFFIITPVVFWSFSNNMIENTLSVFTLTAFLFSFHAVNSKGSKSIIHGGIAGLFVCAAFLSKGLPGLFPLAFPLLIWIFKYNIKFKKIIFDSVVITLPVILIIGLLLLINPAAEFFKNYFHVQVLESINGNREITKEGRFYLLIRLLSELLPMIGIAFLLFITSLKKNIRLFRENRKNKNYLFLFLSIGLSASLPLMVSPKQHGYYMVPAFPFFAIAFGIIVFPIIYRFFKFRTFKPSLLNSMKIIAYFMLAVSLIYSVMHIGQYHRDKALLEDIDIIKTVIPQNTTVSIPKELFENWTLHAYMMRNAKISLDCNINSHLYFLVKNDQSIAIPNGYYRCDLKLKTLGLYTNFQPTTKKHY